MTTGGKKQVKRVPRQSFVKDVENPDVKRFPKFVEATYFDTILHPGDAMFIPYERGITFDLSRPAWRKFLVLGAREMICKKGKQ